MGLGMDQNRTEKKGMERIREQKRIHWNGTTLHYAVIICLLINVVVVDSYQEVFPEQINSL